LGSLKSAALYFDYVIPINLGAEFTEQAQFASFSKELGILLRSLRELIPPNFRNNEGFAKQLGLVNKSTTELMIAAAGNATQLTAPLEDRARLARDSISSLIDQFHLEAALLDCQEGLFHCDSSENSSLEILVQLNLVDTAKAPWDAILELRKDLEAQERLRRLRLFMYENYEGKPASFVEDDILNRISEYEREAKRWGLEVTHSTLSTVLGSKLLGGSFAASLLAIATGAPTAVALGSIGVGTLEIGRVTLDVVRRRGALIDLERRNPVSYISYAKKQLAKKPSGGRKHCSPDRQPW
jgi:hypothetical protein